MNNEELKQEHKEMSDELNLITCELCKADPLLFLTKNE